MLIAVYGTLRKGDYNYERYMGGFQPLVTERIDGYEMFNLGGAYPYITKGADSITVEVYDLPETVAQNIERMERGAGYDMCEVETSLGKARIFYMPNIVDSRAPKILSGDWFQWLKRYQPQRLMKGEGDAF